MSGSPITFKAKFITADGQLQKKAKQTVENAKKSLENYTYEYTSGSELLTKISSTLKPKDIQRTGADREILRRGAISLIKALHKAEPMKPGEVSFINKLFEELHMAIAGFNTTNNEVKRDSALLGTSIFQILFDKQRQLPLTAQQIKILDGLAPSAHVMPEPILNMKRYLSHPQ